MVPNQFYLYVLPQANDAACELCRDATPAQTDHTCVHHIFDKSSKLLLPSPTNITNTMENNLLLFTDSYKVIMIANIQELLKF